MSGKVIALVLLLFLGLSACGVTPKVPEEAAATTTAAVVTPATTETTVAAPLVERKGNSGTNIRNNGHVAYADGWVYISEPRYGHRLDRMREDGSERVTLSEDVCENINVLDGWVYYSIPDWGGKSGIYRMKTDGSEKQVLLDDVKVGRMLVVNEWIYFRTFEMSEHPIYRIRTDGSRWESYALETVDFHHLLDVSGGWVYYTSYSMSEWPVSRVRADGTGQPERLSVIAKHHPFAFEDGWVFFVNEERSAIEKAQPNLQSRAVVYQFPPSEPVLSESFETLHIADGWLYATNYYRDEARREVLRMRTDGTEVTQLCDFSLGEFSIAGSWIYYMTDGGYVFSRIRLDGTGEERFWDEGVDEWPELH